MRMFYKEIKLLYSNKIFLAQNIFSTVLLFLMGYAIKFDSNQSFINLDLVHYLFFVYPITLAFLTLNLYPISKEISEYVNGGIENILATGYEIKKLLLCKALAVFMAMYLPPTAMIIAIMIWSRVFLQAILVLFITLPFVNGSIAINYMTSLISSSGKNKFIKRLPLITGLALFIFTYGPVALVQYKGYSISLNVSIGIYIIFSILIAFNAYCNLRKIDLETVISRGD